MSISSKNRGIVYLIGAGPGDPGLITLRGMEALAKADVVLYDYLVNPVLTVHAPPHAELICLGQHGSTRVWTQAEINQRMVHEAGQGRCVVRLKSGDPSIFGRLISEVECLHAHQIPYVIVPGITAAMAAGAYAGVPLTHRQHASSVAFVTGHEARSKPETRLDFEALARFPGTLVIYMGVTSAESWSGSLIAGGMAPATPVALIRKCSLPEQQMIRCRLDEVASRLTPYSRFPPPVIAIVGEVAGEDDADNWFTGRPLFGKRILITRPVAQSVALQLALSAEGAQSLVQAAIEIAPPDSWDEVDETIGRLNQFDWVVFSSVNGVRYFCERLFEIGMDARQFSSSRLAAIGPSTATALKAYGLTADLVPGQYRAEALAEAMCQRGVAETNCLLIRASRGREVLAERLVQAGAKVHQRVCYRSLDVQQADPTILDSLHRKEIDWITVTSSAIARSLHQLLGDGMRQARLASISPVTTATLEDLGHQVAVEASDYTIEGLVRAMVDASAGQAPQSTRSV